MNIQLSMDDILLDTKEDVDIESLVNRYKAAEDSFRQAIEDFERFKQETPFYKEARINHTCYCDKIRFVIHCATRQFLHPHECMPESPDWVDHWQSWLNDTCSEYSFEEGTVIKKSDRQLYDELEHEITDELNRLRNQLEPLIVSTQKRVYSIGLRKAELTIEETRGVLNGRDHHEQNIERSFNELLAIQQIISDKLLGYLQFDALPVGKRDNIPSNTGGVYLLWKHGELDYIGQSSAMRERLSGHHVFDKEIHLITAVPIEDDEERIGVEEWLIKKLSPKSNIVHNYHH